MNIDIGDVIKINGVLHEVTGVIHDAQTVFYISSYTEKSASFSAIEFLYKE